MILIVGSSGSMGTRYKTILTHLNVPFVGVDKELSLSELVDAAKGFTGIIITTPTYTHHSIVMALLPLGIPILCEKPVTKNLEELDEILEASYRLNCPFDMVYQYKYLVNPKSFGGSYYSYFRHGNDGLVWDCLQIIGLSNGDVHLFEKSPIWNCAINGEPLFLADMDGAYIKQIEDWLKHPRGDFDKIRKMHVKTREFEKSHG